MRSNKRKSGKPNHIITAWSREDGFSLGQKVVNMKSNKITSIPKLLEKIRIKGQVITIDAMGTQTAIAEKIQSKRRDYVLALKENQKNLYEDVRLFLDKESEKKNSAKMGSIKKQWKRHMDRSKSRSIIKQKKSDSWHRKKSGKVSKTSGWKKKQSKKMA